MKSAYEKTMGPHHNWLVRQVAKKAANFSPEKEHFIRSMG